MRLVVYLDRRMMHLLLGRGRRVVPGEEPRGVEVEDPRRGHRDAPPHRAQPPRRHPGPAGRPGDAARPGQGEARPPGRRATTTAELQAIRRLVDEAHRGAKEAITDLRDLARGIHPPALDTGLENALATLAARSPVPTEVTVSIPARPSPADRGHLLLLRR